jgi:stage II sporulation protein AA (anti-sigma F factor antagonist)
MELGVSVHVGDPARVAVVGDLDLAGASLLEGLVRRLARRGRDLVVDLEEVAFIDCGGLGALLRIRRLTESRGGSFRLEHVAPAVRRVIELTGASLPVAGTGRGDPQKQGAGDAAEMAANPGLCGRRLPPARPRLSDTTGAAPIPAVAAASWPLRLN